MSASEPNPPRPPRRPLRRWLILLLVWGIGLCVWALYLGMIGMLLYRWLAADE